MFVFVVLVLVFQMVVFLEFASYHMTSRQAILVYETIRNIETAAMLKSVRKKFSGDWAVFSCKKIILHSSDQMSKKDL